MHHPESRPARRPHLLGKLTRVAQSCSPLGAALSQCRKGLGALGLGLALIGASAPALAEVKVGVSDWPGWVAWYVAEQKGFFKKHKADVKLVWFANYTDSISARRQRTDLVRHHGPAGQGPAPQGRAGE